MTTERQVPGGPFVNETTTSQRQIPGGPYLNDTVPTGTTFKAAWARQSNVVVISDKQRAEA